MKKSMLAMSVAAAIGGLGFAGSALAIGTIAGADADSLVVNPNGIGHQLVVPYFSVQEGNATLLNIVNTDTTNGKLVKVRFRGAGNSDDLYDFQVLMSPGDVWTASVTQDATTGVAKLTTSDATCTIGLGNGLFSTVRTDPDKTVAETREGYVELINMADIISGFALYDTIKHDAGVAECSGTVFNNVLGSDFANVGAAAAEGVVPPTTGLTGDWILLNQNTTAAWSGAATALEARLAGAPAAGNVVFWPQKSVNVSLGNVALASADPLLVGGQVQAKQYDLPDLSTPYISTDTNPGLRADRTTAALAVTSVKNQFETTAGIAAVSDWLFSQPTRRYHVALDYATGDAVYRANSNYYNVGNTEVFGGQVCLNNTEAPGVQSLFDREETSPTVGTDPFVPSPQQPTVQTQLLLCGEANVISFNQDSVTALSALAASVARADISLDYVNGWASWGFENGGYGIPVLGASFMRASNGAVNYGFAFPHKTVAATVN